MSNNNRPIQFTNLILIKDDEVLLQLRDNKSGIIFPGLWAIPGGKVEEDETPEEAVAREMFEETGYRVSDLTYLETGQYDFMESKPLINFYIAKYDNLQPINCFEGQKMEFVPIGQVEKLELFPTHLEHIKNALALDPMNDKP